ncbi:hypothetical protein MTP03_11590 [Tsukamurella sp. PLM1]|nr:hypothetical protein MTP03_11590 [Tsukamurella sp. PLM1]
MLREPGDEFRAAEQDPGLGTAEQFVAAGRHDVGTRRERGGGVGFTGQGGVRGEEAAAEVHDERDVTHGAELSEGHVGGEALDAEVAGVHLEHAPGLGADRLGVVAGVGAVRRADLAQPGARGGDEVRQPESRADLDELAAADDHLAARGERRGGEDQGGGAVVDHERLLRGGARREQRRPGCDPALAPRAGAQVQLDIGVPGGVDEGRDRRGRQRRTAEVGVHHDAGGVEHGPQRGRRRSRELPLDGARDVVRRDLPAARGLLGGTDGGAHPALAEPRGCGRDGRRGEEMVGAGNPPAGVRHPSSSWLRRRPAARGRLAEVDGNRTRQAEILDLTGFEDRGAHQEPGHLHRPT